jgi:hypothetical protein
MACKNYFIGNYFTCNALNHWPVIIIDLGIFINMGISTYVHSYGIIFFILKNKNK